MNFGRLIYEKSLWTTVFPRHTGPCFLFLSPLRLPQGFFLLLSAIVLYNKIKDGGRDISSFKKRLSLSPNMYARIAGRLLPSILYKYYYSPQSLMGSTYLSQFKLTRI